MAKELKSAFCAAVAAWCLACAAAQGQLIEVIDDEDAVGEKQHVGVRADRVIIDLAARPAAAAGVMPPESFDRCVFRDLNSSALQEKLEGWLSSRLAEIDVQCRLTPAQQDKLKLAGRMEIYQVFERIAARRREFELVRRDWAAGNRFLQELESLNFALAHRKTFFRENSLVDKVAQTTLSTEQLQPYHERLERDRREHRAWLQTKLLRDWDKQVGQLTDKQRGQLIALLDEFPLQPIAWNDARQLWEFAADIPAEKYEEILDDRQWNDLNSIFEKTRQFHALHDQMVKRAGF